jgi:ABC-2 type transport system permease protein
MKSMLKMTWMETRLFLREPVGAFFTLVFPLMMLFIFGSTMVGKTASEPGTTEMMQMLIPSLSAMVIGITGLMAVTMTMATYRENGILRRLRTTPVSPLVVMGSQVVVVFTMTCLGMLLLAAAGRFFYQIRFEGSILSVGAGFVLSSLSFFGIGFILAGTLPTARTAQISAMVLMYPMLILSGAAWPRELMPAAAQRVSAFLPLTYVVNLLRGLWNGDAWSSHLLDVGVLVVMLVVGVVLSAKLFRWE